MNHYTEFVITFQHFIFGIFRLVNVDEQKQRASMEKHYKELKLAEERKAKIARLQYFGRVTFPNLCIGFITVFWLMGLNHVS